jgi:hypothetical protein
MPPSDDPPCELPDFLVWAPPGTTLDGTGSAEIHGGPAPDADDSEEKPAAIAADPSEEPGLEQDGVGTDQVSSENGLETTTGWEPRVVHLEPQVSDPDDTGALPDRAERDGEEAAVASPEASDEDLEATVDNTASAVHPWIARRQGRRQRTGTRRRGWLVIGLVSAVVGTIGVLALTGGLERLVPALPTFEGLADRSAAPRATVPLDAPVVFPIRSRPAGAELFVDGQPTGRRTPVTDIELGPGRHAVELRLADLGSWSGTITVPAGVAVADGADLLLAGSLTAVTDKAVAGVEVHLDDTPLGLAPVTRDSVAVGQHVVRFKGPGGYTWDEEIVVRVDEVAEVVARMDGVESFGLVTVRSYNVGPTGKSFVDGDQVVVDGEAHGGTPAEIYLTAGRHVVDVTRPGHGSVTQVVAVVGGDRRYVDVRLDRLPALRIEHEPPARMEVDTTPLVSVTLSGQGADRRRRVTMHVEFDGAWQRLRMGAVPGATATYVVGLPVTSGHAGEGVRYYFTSEDPAGRTAYTTIFTVSCAP